MRDVSALQDAEVASQQNAVLLESDVDEFDIVEIVAVRNVETE